MSHAQKVIDTLASPTQPCSQLDPRLRRIANTPTCLHSVQSVTTIDSDTHKNHRPSLTAQQQLLHRLFGSNTLNQTPTLRCPSQSYTCWLQHVRHNAYTFHSWRIFFSLSSVNQRPPVPTRPAYCEDHGLQDTMIWRLGTPTNELLLRAAPNIQETMLRIHSDHLPFPIQQSEKTPPCRGVVSRGHSARPHANYIGDRHECLSPAPRVDALDWGHYGHA